MNYLALLDHSYEVQRREEENFFPTKSAYLAEYIFLFITYDGEMDVIFGRKAVEVCEAINNNTTFQYIKNKENYKWYLWLLNTPFFIPKLEWGSSIRGAWWKFTHDTLFELNSCGLYAKEESLGPIQFDEKQWDAFVKAMVKFISEEEK